MDGDSSVTKVIKAVKKNKAIIPVFLVMIALVLYLNTYLVAGLTRTIEFSQYIFGLEVIKTVIFHYGQEFLAVVLLEIAGIAYVICCKPNYHSKLITVTPEIHTPAAAGDGQHGTAKWLEESKYDKTFDSCMIPGSISIGKLNKYNIPEGGLVLGKTDVKAGEKIYTVNSDTHVLYIGGTRSGKTRCSVLQTIGVLGLAGESMVVTDVKGELVDYTRPYLEELGYEVYVINYDEPIYSDLWNYLQVVNNFVDQGDIPAAIDAAWDLTSQLVGEAKGEKIWNDGEASMIAAGIMAVVYDNKDGENKKYRNLANVYYFLVNMCKQVGKVLPLSVYVEMLPEDHPARGLLGVSDVAPSRTRSSFYTSALMTLKLFTNPYIANMSSASSFDPADLGRKKMAVFIVLPDDRKTYHSLATLFVSQAYTILSKEAKAKGGRLDNRVNFVCDEFGNFTKMENFEQMLTVGGGKGIRYFLFIQSYAQLENKYEKTGMETIKDNCDTTVYIKSNNNDTLKAVSDKLGDYTVQGYTTNTSSNSSGSKVTSVGSSNNLTGRKLLFPEEVGKIKRPYTLVITEDDPAIMYDPDLSQWKFNELYGMRGHIHNKKLRRERQAERTRHELPQQIPLWGIWNIIIDRIKRKNQEQIMKKQLEEMTAQQTEMLNMEEDDD